MGIPVLQTLHFHSDHSWVPTCLNPILVTSSFEQNVFYKFFMMKHNPQSIKSKRVCYKQFEKDFSAESLKKCETVVNSLPCKNILHWANICFSAHAISQPCAITTSEALLALKSYAIKYRIQFGMF